MLIEPSSRYKSNFKRMFEYFKKYEERANHILLAIYELGMYFYWTIGFF